MTSASRERDRLERRETCHEPRTRTPASTSPAGTSSRAPRSASGGLALSSLGGAARGRADRPAGRTRSRRGRRTSPAKAKRVIYLHMSGSPPHLDLFDYKPELVKHDGQDCPDEFLKGKRFAFTSRRAQAARHAAARSRSTARPASGCPTRSRTLHDVADDLCRHPVDVHRPVQPRPGRAAALHRLAAAGPAVDGLVGDATASAPRTQNLPGFVVLISSGVQPSGGQSCWGSGFLPSVFQGVQCRSQGRPGPVRLRPARHGPRPAPAQPRRPAAT